MEMEDVAVRYPRLWICFAVALFPGVRFYGEVVAVFYQCLEAAFLLIVR